MTESSFLSTHTVNDTKINETLVQNGTNRDEDFFRILSYVALPFHIVGLIGNGAIFWLLCRIKKTKYTIYVLNLAIADFIVVFCSITTFVLDLILWGDEAIQDYIYHAIDILAFFGYNTSFFLLTAISIERCLGAFYPLWYHYDRPNHLSTILCALLWVLSCVVSGVEYFTCWLECARNDRECYKKYNAAYVFLIAISLIFTPVMVFCSLSLCVKIRLHHLNAQVKFPGQSYFTIVATVVLFLIFALPFRLNCLIVYWYPKMEFKWMIFQTFCFLDLINSSLNPFAYFLIRRKEKLRFCELLSRMFQRF